MAVSVKHPLKTVNGTKDPERPVMESSAGIERLLRGGSHQRVEIEAATPVRIDHPVVSEHSQFESSVAVSLPVQRQERSFHRTFALTEA